MQALDDIFAIWGPVRVMSAALNEKQDTVYRWKRRKRIPEGAWQSVIDAALVKGKILTVADLHAANRPPLPRGRRTHKAKRRAESRAIP